MQREIASNQPEHHATLIPDSDLAMARQIYHSMLPRDYQSPQLETAVRCRAADWLGGDYATVSAKPDGSVFLAMCDVCGHGVASALLATRVNSFVRDHAEQSRDLCDLAESLNQFIFENFYLCGVYATFVAAEIRPERHEILFNSWAHPPGLLYHTGTGTFEQLNSRRVAIGVARTFPQSCTISSARYEPGDRLMFYTDGLTEARTPAGEFFGIERLQEFLRTDAATLSSAVAADTILARVEKFRDGEPCDDRLVMVVNFFDGK